MTSVSTVGQEALERLESHLAEHKHLQVERTETSVKVFGTPETGFDVQIDDGGSQALISAGGWHEHYGNPEEAAATFMWLLTPSTRIVVGYRGDQMVSWKLQWEEDGKWVTGGRGAVLLGFLIRGAKREVVLQNRLLPT